MDKQSNLTGHAAMTNQLSQPIRGKNRITNSLSMSGEALLIMFAGVCGLPILGIACLLTLDLSYLESLPKSQEVLCFMGMMALIILPSIAFTYLFGVFAVRLLPRVSSLELYENGLAISAYGEKDKFHRFEDFDRILIEQSEEYIGLEFFRGEGHWVLTVSKKGGAKKFARVAHLAATFPQGRPKQGPPTQWRPLW